MSLIEDIVEGIRDGEIDEVIAYVKKALKQNILPLEIMNDGLLAGMEIVGELFKDGELYIPEVLMSAKAMTKGLEELKPYLGEADSKSPGTVIIGTVHGDLHDIGKNIVKMLMSAKGLDVIDLGHSVTTDDFVKAAAEYNANIVCCSALLTSTMGEMKNIVEALKEAGLENVKVMVGGAPLSQAFCDKIGAYKYTSEASAAAEAALAICKA